VAAAAFIGFTDIGKSIVSVSLTSATNDIVAIDDIRYGNAAAFRSPRPTR
jgi:hypothetical protein